MGTTIRSEELIAGFDDDRFRHIDGSVRSTLFQTAHVAGGFVAAAGLVATTTEGLLGLPLDAVGLAVRGVLVALAGGAALHLTVGRRARRALLEQRALVHRATAELHAEATRHRFRSELDEGLRMCEDEDDVVELVGRSLDRVDAAGRMELLLADASNAHLSVAVESTGGGAGCSVSTPHECPAVRRGTTRRFETSSALDACPKLRNRDEALGATCVPLVVLGTPVGVVHRVDPDRKPPKEIVVDELETMADLVGSRLSVIRAIVRNERQASTDALTGMLNRRATSDRLRDLHRRDEPYAVVFCDLDHFKDLNDTYGHDAGDRALKLFAKTARATVRDHDVVGRWGGEEFVLVFPGADRAIASLACERLRTNLVGALSEASTPPFTASFGVADQTQADSIEGVLTLADRAMFVAKSRGRDRVLLADDDLEVPPEMRDLQIEGA